MDKMVNLQKNSKQTMLKGKTTATAKSPILKILIVEDSFMVRAALEEMLSQLGYSADFAQDGKTALALYRSDYHLILMDIELPDIDGITITQTIRSIERDQHVPIVAISSHTENEFKEKCFSVGMNGYSNKRVRLKV